MKKGLWFLIAAISLSAFAGYLLPDRPTLFLDSQGHVENAGERISRPAATVVGKAGHPAVSSRNETAGRPVPELAQASSSALPKIAFGKGQPEMLTPSGVPVSDVETVDLQEIEDRILGEQLAESLRNPAYLLATVSKVSEPIDPDDSEEMQENTDGAVSADSFEKNGFADEEIEEGPQVADGQLPNEDQPAEHALLTEAGIPIGTEMVDLAEIEDRILNAQLEESLRNPAYLQGSPAE